MAFGDPPIEPSSPSRASTREPVSLLVLGALLYLLVLGLIWYRGETRDTGGTEMTARMAQLNTYVVSALWYWDLRGDVIPTGSIPVTVQARQVAQLWQSVGQNTDDVRYQAQTEVNAAALYGVANNLPAARRALRRAMRLAPADAATYRRLLPLYQRPAQPIAITGELSRAIDALSTGPLIRARNAKVAHHPRVAQQAIRQAAERGIHALIVLGLIGVLGFVIVVAALAIFLVKYRQVVASLRAVRTSRPLALPWGIGTALIVISAHHLLSFALSMGLMHLTRPFTGQAMPVLIVQSTVATILSAVIVLGILLVLTGKRPWEWRAFGWQPTRYRAGYGVTALLIILPLFWAVSVLSGLIFKDQGGTNPLIPAIFATKNPWMLIYFFLAVTVMAPLVEETMYRGLLFRALGERMAFWPAALLSGFLFAMAHGQLAAILPITVLGTTFAFLTRRSRGLWASAAAHGVYNGLVTAVLLLLVWVLR